MTSGGYQDSHDGVLRHELLLRAGGADTLLGSADVAALPGDAGLSGEYSASFDLPATAAQCDDLLVVRVTMLSGASSFLELATTLQIP